MHKMGMNLGGALAANPRIAASAKPLRVSGKGEQAPQRRRRNPRRIEREFTQRAAGFWFAFLENSERCKRGLFGSQAKRVPDGLLLRTEAAATERKVVRRPATANAAGKRRPGPKPGTRAGRPQRPEKPGCEAPRRSKAKAAPQRGPEPVPAEARASPNEREGRERPQTRQTWCFAFASRESAPDHRTVHEGAKASE